TGAFGETEAATPGAANLCPPPAGWDGIVINEIESSGGDPGDWVELYNTGNGAVDLTGWIVKDNDDSHAIEIAAGTVIGAGGFVVVYTDTAVNGFGLGNPDEPRLFLPDGVTLVDSHAYTEHAPSTTYGRCPDGTGEFVETFASTPGAANDCSPVRINEVDSTGADPVDWVELTNAGSEAIDVSGYILRDNKDTSEIVIAPGTTIEPGAYLAIDVDIDGGFGLGAADAARLFAADGVTLLDSTTWAEHAATSWARCPDGIGAFEVAQSVTKGQANDCVGLVSATAWPGGADVDEVSAPGAFGQDMSGLAFEATGVARGTLWAVNNGSGTLYKLEWDATADQWVPASGEWAAGKTLRYSGGAGKVDAEGVGLVAGSSANGVYVATERDNTASSVSRPSVLLFDASASGTELTATAEWNLASLLPALPANGGLEGIAWVSDADLTSRGFIDESTGGAYDPAAYAGHGNGLFFVGVEGTARIYAVALQAGGTASLIATIDPKLALVAEVAYDAASGALYAVCDDACAGEIHDMKIAQEGPLAGSFQIVASYLNPAGMDDKIANEGFAIGTCTSGVAPTFYADDSETGGTSLREGTMACVSAPFEPTDPGAGGGSGGPGEVNPPAEAALTPETQGAIQPQGGTTFEQGQTVTITVGTQYAGQTVEGWIFSTPTYLGTSVVSAAGTATFTIPADLPVGTHRLVVTDSAGTVIGWTYVQVEALAATGGTAESTGMPLLPWAAALILLGAALVVIRRRQRKA
ncbi:lamin tail domain-containing protein, partial [Microbacterium sp.]|uniref:lamin tail domain-containing protein n=1 Tax=Microbacterium sp. TaxID=51671 RepID=UPI0026136D20